MSKTVKDPLIIELQYLPAIAWFEAIKDHPFIYLDKHEHYVKASYRNRCHILGPNGLLRLSIPLVHGKHQHRAAGDVNISYEQNWQKNHWMTICSCYRRSAFFEFYEDQFYPFYHSQYEKLFDLNFELLKLILKILKIDTGIRFTEKYIEPGTEGYDDKRSLILPDGDNTAYFFKPYTQVFSDRFDFFPNLSMIDHIFNNGNKF